MGKRKIALCVVLAAAVIGLIGFVAWKVLVPTDNTEMNLAQKRTEASAYDRTFGGTALVFLAVRPDGTLQAVVPDDSNLDQQIAGWSEVVQADSPNTSSIVALQADGNCLCVSDDAALEAEVKSWNDITQIACGRDVVFGLKKDGTVVCAGEGIVGLDKISGWVGVKSIATGHSVRGLDAVTEDGTSLSSSEMQTAIDDLTGIESFSGSGGTIALLEDGSAFVWGIGNETAADEVSTWTDLVQVELGSGNVAAGLRADGTVLVADNGGSPYYEEVATWRNVVDIAVYYSLVIALDADGTVRIAGSSPGGDPMHFKGWQYDNCVAVFANDQLGCALRSDGSVIDFAYHASGKTMEPLW